MPSLRVNRFAEADVTYIGTTVLFLKFGWCKSGRGATAQQAAAIVKPKITWCKYTNGPGAFNFPKTANGLTGLDLMVV